MTDKFRDDLHDLLNDLGDREEYPADPAFDAWIAQVAPTLNAPGATPRAEMWREIQAARTTALEAQAGRIPGVRPIRRLPWRTMSLVAAALLLGIAVDRMMIRRDVAPAVQSVASSVAPADSIDTADASTRLYRFAAFQTLTQAEALLTAYRAGGSSAPAAENVKLLDTWGRQVLGSTRLLIDSPAGRDPRMRRLLEDLELVLVQLIQLSNPQVTPGDREHVDRALEDSDLLPRIRTAVPASAVAASSE